jgi:hypothetical protein
LQQYRTNYGRKKFKKNYPRHDLPTNLFDQFGEFENSENSDNSTFADPLDGTQPDVIPKISEKIEVYQSAKTAFMHLMKTKIGPDEEIPENLLEIIENSLSTPQENEKFGTDIKFLRLIQMMLCTYCVSTPKRAQMIHQDVFNFQERLSLQSLSSLFKTLNF